MYKINQLFTINIINSNGNYIQKISKVPGLIKLGLGEREELLMLNVILNG